MGRKSNSESVAIWRARLEGQRRSRLSVAECCRREGVGVSTFYAWRHRLKTLAKVAAKPRLGRKLKQSNLRRNLEGRARVASFAFQCQHHPVSKCAWSMAHC